MFLRVQQETQLHILHVSLLCVAAVVPRDSAWFSFYNGTALVPLEEQPLYTEDWIGLKRLHQTGGLVFEEAPGEHMQFTLDWYTKNVIDKYLSGDDPAQKQQQHFAGGYRANC